MSCYPAASPVLAERLHRAAVNDRLKFTDKDTTVTPAVGRISWLKQVVASFSRIYLSVTLLGQRI